MAATASSLRRVIQRHRTFHGGKRDAENALRRFVAEVEGERPELPTDATLAQLLERWLHHIEGDHTISTMADYRGKIAGRINPVLGNVRLSKLSAPRLDDAYRRWQKDGLAAGTIRKQHAIIAAACHQAVKRGILAESPTDRATVPRSTGPAVERGTLTAEDVAAVLRKATPIEEGGVLAVAVLLGALTGMRRGELCALRWNDYDPVTGLQGPPAA